MRRSPFVVGVVVAPGGSGDVTVSVDAIYWTLNLAPVPADRGGQPRTFP